MKSSSTYMFRELMQLYAQDYCNIVSQGKNGFSAELSVRNGRYIIRLDYYENSSPNLFLVKPEIDMSNPIEIHTYGEKYHPYYKRKLPKLCLSYWEVDKWNVSIPLMSSYIPWAIEWTEFYETWLLTGKWYGKGIHLTGEDKSNE